MTDERLEDDVDDFHDSPCALCGAQSAIFVDLAADHWGAVLDEAFCSWDHFAEWVAQGKPEPDRWMRLDEDMGTLTDLWWRAQWRITIVYEYLRAGLAAYGLYMLGRRWVAKHPDEAARVGRRFPRLTRLLGALERRRQADTSHG